MANITLSVLNPSKSGHTCSTQTYYTFFAIRMIPGLQFLPFIISFWGHTTVSGEGKVQVQASQLQTTQLN